MLKNYNFVTHLDKVFWEKEGITKGEVLDYYGDISKTILPHLKDRPESLRRFPNGIDQPHFFQKNLTTHPEWVSTVEIEHSNKMVKYLVIQDVESLIYAANLGCIEIHPWFSRYQSLDNPDFLIFDLDPVDIPFDAVVEVSQAIFALLEKIGVVSYPKTSGGRGMHIAVPLKAKYTYEQAKQFALLVAMVIHKQLPAITSLERMPSKRQKRVYIDCFQNNFGQTFASAYSLRARPGAAVSTPLEWKEVRKGLNPLDYNLFNTYARVLAKGDLFKPVLQKGIDMKKALPYLQEFFFEH